MTNLKCVLESVDGGGVKSTDNFEDAVEVVQFLEHYHDLKDAGNYKHPLLKVTCFQDALFQPECKLKQKAQPRMQWSESNTEKHKLQQWWQLGIENEIETENKHC